MKHEDIDHTGLTGVGGAFAGVRAYHNASQAVNHNTDTQLALNSERYDTDAFHDNATNNSRLTVPTGKAGKYLIGGSIAFPNGGADRHFQAKLNGTTSIVVQFIGSGASIGYASFVTTWDLAVGDYVSMWAYQTSGGTITVPLSTGYQCEFWMSRLG